MTGWVTVTVTYQVPSQKKKSREVMEGGGGGSSLLAWSAVNFINTSGCAESQEISFASQKVARGLKYSCGRPDLAYAAQPRMDMRQVE